MNELLKRGHEGVGSDIQENYSGVSDGSAVTKAPYVALDITDKDAVENACSSANKNSLSFLPVLGAGEAILMGVDFPMPVVLKVNKPIVEPNSATPQFVLP